MEIIGSILVIIFIIIWLFYRINKTNKIILKWIENNNYKLLEKKYLFFGPFFSFRFSSLQFFYDIKYEANNNLNEKWIKIGEYWIVI